MGALSPLAVIAHHPGDPDDRLLDGPSTDCAAAVNRNPDTHFGTDRHRTDSHGGPHAAAADRPHAASDGNDPADGRASR